MYASLGQVYGDSFQQNNIGKRLDLHAGQKKFLECSVTCITAINVQQSTYYLQYLTFGPNELRATSGANYVGHYLW